MFTISRDQVGGLLFLCFSLVYGYYARDIALMPGDEYQSFNAQTLPNMLAILSGLLSCALIVSAKRDFHDRIDLVGYRFSLVIKLLFLIVMFAFSLTWVGFLVSTIAFLSLGFWLLGERRIKMILLIAGIFAVVIWFILSVLLGVYLAPGQLFTLFLGH